MSVFSHMTTSFTEGFIIMIRKKNISEELCCFSIFFLHSQSYFNSTQYLCSLVVLWMYAVCDDGDGGNSMSTTRATSLWQ